MAVKTFAMDRRKEREKAQHLQIRKQTLIRTKIDKNRLHILASALSQLPQPHSHAVPFHCAGKTSRGNGSKEKTKSPQLQMSTGSQFGKPRQGVQQLRAAPYRDPQYEAASLEATQTCSMDSFVRGVRANLRSSEWRMCQSKSKPLSLLSLSFPVNWGCT